MPPLFPKQPFYRTTSTLFLNTMRLLRLLFYILLASGIFSLVHELRDTPPPTNATIRSLLLTTHRLTLHLPSSLPFRLMSPTSIASQQVKKPKPQRAALPPTLRPFLVDTAGVATWVRLGFSKKQAASILRYREKSGGFRNKEHFRRCYVVSEEAYTRLAPYLLFQKKTSDVNKPTRKLFPFNPDTASAATFEALGFSAKQAQVLLNYRKSLGGSFGTPERFARSYVVDSARFQTLKPYLRFE